MGGGSSIAFPSWPLLGRYGLHVAAGLLLTMHLALIIGLLLQRAGRLRARREAQRSREHLVHLARVSSMGELVASLAHELNQPLTAVLTNVGSAQRLLSRNGVPVSDLKEIVQDITDDVKRATDVLARIGDMVSRRPIERAVVDVNEIVRSVAKLLSSEAANRRVPIALALAPGPLIAQADRVQLQQVVLNLLLNALDAASSSREGLREVEISTQLSDPRTVHLVLRDSGPGLGPGMEQQVFEPFYTTKGTGMGMGLWITRSIVDSHGGTIWAVNRADGGAEFHVMLPTSG